MLSIRSHRLRLAVLAVAFLVAGSLLLKHAVLSSASSSSLATTKIVYESDQTSDERGEGFQVYVANGDGSGATQLTTSTRTGEPTVNFQPALSPDGSKIAFVSTRAGSGHIFVMSAAGTNVTQITSGDYIDSSPTWSPTGNQIAFARAPVNGGGSKIYIMNADGSGVRQLTTGASTVTDSSPTWSTSTGQIAFDSDRSGTNRIYVINTDGTTLVTLTSPPAGAADAHPSWAPGGRQIAFDRQTAQGGMIDVVSTSGSGLKAITSGSAVDSHPTWSPDGTTLAFERQGGTSSGDQARIYSAAGAGTSTVTALTSSGSQTRHPSW